MSKLHYIPALASLQQPAPSVCVYPMSQKTTIIGRGPGAGQLGAAPTLRMLAAGGGSEEVMFPPSSSSAQSANTQAADTT